MKTSIEAEGAMAVIDAPVVDFRSRPRITGPWWAAFVMLPLVLWQFTELASIRNDAERMVLQQAETTGHLNTEVRKLRAHLLAVNARLSELEGRSVR
jgi:hypothetical protein